MSEQPPAALACVSVILCDDIYRDVATLKMVIVGTFNIIRTPKVPCTHPRMAILVTLTGGPSTQDVGVSIEHEQSSNRIVHIEGPLTEHDPLRVFDLVLHLVNVPFADVGKYWVVVREGEKIIGRRPFSVELVPSALPNTEGPHAESSS